MCMVTGALLEQATRSACQTDQAAAHWVVAGAVELDRQRGHAEELVVRLLALQAPVATDLRRVVSALWIVGDVHRMGMLAIHVAQATLRRYPEPVLPVTIRPVFTRMGQIGEQLAGQAATALRQRDVALAQAVSARNPEMDRLHRELLAAAPDPSWPYGVAAAIDVLCARPVLRPVRRPRRRRHGPSHLPGHRPPQACRHRMTPDAPSGLARPRTGRHVKRE